MTTTAPYAPRRFAEASRTRFLAEVLRQHVASQRVPPAYLFGGPAGSGKREIGRVLAMAYLCPDRGEDGEPCGVCAMCENVWAGNGGDDAVEIDPAAPHNEDEARTLRERAMHAPPGRKVYLVTNADALSREATSALAPILRVPPDEVLFIFTTEHPERFPRSGPGALPNLHRFTLQGRTA